MDDPVYNAWRQYEETHGKKRTDGYVRVPLYTKMGIDPETGQDVYALADLPAGRIVAERVEDSYEDMESALDYILPSSEERLAAQRTMNKTYRDMVDKLPVTFASCSDEEKYKGFSAGYFNPDYILQELIRTHNIVPPKKKSLWTRIKNTYQRFLDTFRKDDGYDRY